MIELIVVFTLDLAAMSKSHDMPLFHDFQPLSTIFSLSARFSASQHDFQSLSTIFSLSTRFSASQHDFQPLNTIFSLSSRSFLSKD
jgi:hypothetical protein